MVLVTRPLDQTAFGSAYLEAFKQLPFVNRISLQEMEDVELQHLLAVALQLELEDLPANVRILVTERAQGNPFFAQEMVRNLLESGLIQIEETPEGTRCLADVNLAEATRLPNTLEGLILARIDRLKPEEQLVLKIAAVIGRSFAVQPLRQVLQVHFPDRRTELKAHLRRFTALDLAAAEIPEPELTYLFKHIITHEVTYQTLLFAQRRALHRSIAEWYELHYGEESKRWEDSQNTLSMDQQLAQVPENLAPYLPLLAYHYRHAELPEEEVGYVRLSAQQARSQYANQEALAYLARALALTSEDKPRFELLQVQEEILGILGNRADQRQTLQTLQQLAIRLNNSRARAEILFREADFLMHTEGYPQAQEVAEQLIALGQAEGVELIQARGIWMRGQVHVLTGAYQQALADFQTVLSLFKKAEFPE